MMGEKYLYSVYDKRSGMFSDPFVAVTDQVALRDFQKSCSINGSPLNDFAEDYSLVRLGSFGLESGFIVSDGPETICQASGFKRGES